MFEQLIQGPASEPVTVVEQAAFSRFDAPDPLVGSPPSANPDYTLVQSQIATAREEVERLTRFCLMTQKWKLALSGFPNRFNRFFNPVFDRILGHMGQGSIELMRRPVQTIDLIEYLDTDGAVQTFDPSNYALANDCVVLEIGKTWPVTAHREDAVRISTTVGFDPAGSPPTTTPERLLTAVKFLAGWYYENRVPVTTLLSQDVMMTLTNLLRGFRSGYLPRIADSSAPWGGSCL